MFNFQSILRIQIPIINKLFWAYTLICGRWAKKFCILRSFNLYAVDETAHFPQQHYNLVCIIHQLPKAGMPSLSRKLNRNQFMFVLHMYVCYKYAREICISQTFYDDLQNVAHAILHILMPLTS